MKQISALRHLVPVMLIVVGIIHLLPASGVIGAERISALYGISMSEPNLVLLMRHRAVLFGLLGLFLVFAAFKPAFHLLALIAATASVVSFLALAWPASNYNAQVRRVFGADVLALACLVVGWSAFLHGRLAGHASGAP